MKKKESKVEETIPSITYGKLGLSYTKYPDGSIEPSPEQQKNVMLALNKEAACRHVLDAITRTIHSLLTEVENEKKDFWKIVGENCQVNFVEAPAAYDPYRGRIVPQKKP